MNTPNIFIRLSLIFSEACFFSLLYLSVIMFTDNNVLINPLLFFAAAGLIGVINISLSFRKQRLTKVILINLVLFAFLELLAYFISGQVTLTPSGIVPLYHIVIIHSILFILFFRSIYLSYKKELNIYGHFDLFIFLTFLVILASGLLEIGISGGIVWSLLVFFFNLLPLYIKNNSGDEQKPKSAWILLIAAFIFLWISNRSYSLLHNVSGTAGTVYDFIESIFMAVLNVFLAILVFFVKHTSGKGLIREDQNTGSSLSQQIPMDSISSEPNQLLTILLWLFFVVLALVSLVLLYYLLSLFISWLMKQQIGEHFEQTSHPFTGFKNILILLLNSILKKIVLASVWVRTIKTLLPFGTPISINTAYIQLLKWGARKKHPRKISETPNEYCNRLTKLFPDLKSELKEITDLYVVYSYSENTLSERSNPQFKPRLRKLYFYRLFRVKNFILKFGTTR